MRRAGIHRLFQRPGTVNTEPGLTVFGLDQFMASDNNTVSRVEDIPGTDLDVQIRNLPPDPVLVSYAVIGRTN